MLPWSVRVWQGLHPLPVRACIGGWFCIGCCTSVTERYCRETEFGVAPGNSKRQLINVSSDHANVAKTMPSNGS
jgi:hypothetical protein